jgi:hypothetical protein
MSQTSFDVIVAGVGAMMTIRPHYLISSGPF